MDIITRATARFLLDVLDSITLQASSPDLLTTAQQITDAREALTHIISTEAG
jgi:hypothetical protein